MEKTMKNKPVKLAAGENILHLLQEDSEKIKDFSKINGVAYSGGTFAQWWGGRIVVDLKGMELSKQIPLLIDHANTPEYKIGEVTATISSNISVTGSVSSKTERGKSIIEMGKQYDWQLSIGAEAIEKLVVANDEKIEVNGTMYDGPLTVVTKSKLREVSVVAVGADSDTYMKIAAKFGESKFNPKSDQQGENTMKVEPVKKVEAKETVVIPEAETHISEADIKAKAEADAQKRINSIIELTAGNLSLREKALTNGWTESRTKDVVEALAAATKTIPESGVNILMKSNSDLSAKTVEAAMFLRSGFTEEEIIASCGEQQLQLASSQYRDMGLKDSLRVLCQLEGKPVSNVFNNDTIKAAFTTVSLPGILSNVAHKAALKSYNARGSVADKLCSVGNLSDYKEASRYRLSDVGDIDELEDGGEIQTGTLGEDSAKNQLKTYAKMFEFGHKMVANDDLGLFLKIPKSMGTKCQLKKDKVFFERLKSNPIQADGKALFSASHKNYTSGSDSALSLTSLPLAYTKFLQQVDAAGDSISVAPKYLLVPTGLYNTGLEILNSQTIQGSTAKSVATNIITKYGLTLVYSQLLDTAATGWYLFGDPNVVDTFEIGYFNGRTAPTVEQIDVAPNKLGLAFRCFFNFGIREQDHRGMTFNAGA